MIQKREVRDAASSGYLNAAGEEAQKDLMTNQEFHPMLYKQHEGQPYLELAGFNEAVDEFFSKLESQKLDLKIVHQVQRPLVRAICTSRLFYLCMLQKKKIIHSKTMQKIREEFDFEIFQP